MALEAARFPRAEYVLGSRVRRVLFTTMKLSDREDSAPEIAGTSSYDTIEEAPGFGLRNVGGKVVPPWTMIEWSLQESSPLKSDPALRPRESLPLNDLDLA